MVALIVISCVFSYIFMGAYFGSRDHHRRGKDCTYYPNRCFRQDWCSHGHISVWIAGVLWPFMGPIGLGIKAGGTSKESRTENRRAKELEEANHRLQLAKINAEVIQSNEKAVGIK